MLSVLGSGVPTSAHCDSGDFLRSFTKQFSAAQILQILEGAPQRTGQLQQAETRLRTSHVATLAVRALESNLSRAQLLNRILGSF